MTSWSRCVLAAVTAASGLALAGCASSSPPPATSSGASASAAGTATGQPATRAAECTPAQLAVAYTDNAQIRDGALDGMSHADSVIRFTNISSSTCWTRGYPGVTALNAAGQEIKNAVRGRAADGQIPLITLASGQVASAEITGNTASCSSLTKIAKFLITVPDQRTPAQLPGTRALCLGSLGIDPLERGNAGGMPL